MTKGTLLLMLSDLGDFLDVSEKSMLFTRLIYIVQV
jgi:hypothetical protein